MKKFNLIVIFGCLLFVSSCDKYSFLPDEYSEIFLGDWKWIGTSCPESYLNADSVDYSLKLILDNNGKYYYKNDTLIVTSNYQFQFDRVANNIRRYKVRVDNDSHTYFVFIINYNNEDILVTLEDGPDTCELYWERDN